jgi:CO/xanthine dehydrogenase FAD-binding subunit
MYLQPQNLNEALSMLQESNPKVIAGGTDVYPTLSAGHQIAKFLDVTRIHGFNEISSQDRVVRIGPAVTWSDILQADLPPAFDALKQAACEVGACKFKMLELLWVTFVMHLQLQMVSHHYSH